MSWSEFFTIYLSIGAPFGVYFFLSRRRRISAALFLKTIAVGLFWILFAPQLFYSLLKSSKKTRINSDLSREKMIDLQSRRLLQIFGEFSLNEQCVSFFVFRETLERCIGLTLGLQKSAVDRGEPAEPEILKVAGGGKENLQTAARCFKRRNLLRLQQHQSRAEHDFLQICRQTSEISSLDANAELDLRRDFLKHALKLCELLYSVEATARLREMREDYERERQRKFAANVSDSDRQEQDLWKTWQPDNIQPRIQPLISMPQTTPPRD